MSDLKRYMHAVKRPVAMVLLGSAMVFSLQGCFGVIAGGVVAGTLAATDRRTLGAQTEDKSIAVKGEMAIPKVVGDAGHVNVTSFNRKVLLTGEVPSEAAKEAAAREASRIEGVQSVVNELAVSGASGFGSRSNDTLITGKVKASIVDNRTLYANSIKVVTERGIVYLMGRVTEREGDLAANIARGVSGVQKVVKVFEYISDEEYRMLTTTPESQPAQKQ
ncbi:MAG: BON domain-containing protein [Burkholderiaceae bacterium]|uniref:BON domain-containing protein n=1 Tax=Herminiimonas contaminans TaxID=1111140 RepID=A0ABS0EZ36_9BURK|nr:BON domain-containing protein [Herminiimonas contaminans]MBF8179368.1 BON domain-containing protein [Herminiimonas contaminans]MBX9798047.1 BON domain-containing protein [Burkholderiaceae bacterium]